MLESKKTVSEKTGDIESSRNTPKTCTINVCQASGLITADVSSCFAQTATATNQESSEKAESGDQKDDSKVSDKIIEKDIKIDDLIHKENKDGSEDKREAEVMGNQKMGRKEKPKVKKMNLRKKIKSRKKANLRKKTTLRKKMSQRGKMRLQIRVNLRKRQKLRKKTSLHSDREPVLSQQHISINIHKPGPITNGKRKK